MGMNRIEMAKETGSQIIVTACPWCDKNFRDILKEGDGMEVKNVIDLLNEFLEE
jgi:Fe-S oxidoreductase